MSLEAAACAVAACAMAYPAFSEVILERQLSPSAASSETSLPLPQARPVALRGKMSSAGYIPENWVWVDQLTKADDETGRTNSTGQPRRIGLNPMSLPLEILTASGHGPRQASRVIQAMDDEQIDHGIRTLKQLRLHCLSCTENAAEVRRCAIINCPMWPYRMGHNPHNPRRGRNPFAAKQVVTAR